jgi:hypothetical protein
MWLFIIWENVLSLLPAVTGSIKKKNGFKCQAALPPTFRSPVLVWIPVKKNNV